MRRTRHILFAVLAGSAAIATQALAQEGEPSVGSSPGPAPSGEALAAPLAPHAEPFGARRPPPDRAVEIEKYPRIGGHVGVAVPIATLAKDSTVIGADFVTLGVTPGLTVHLDDNGRSTSSSLRSTS